MHKERPIVYLVDDDKIIQQATHALLSQLNWEISCLSEAAEFLNVFQSERPGCLVLDVQLPDMNGLELQKILSNWQMDIPIVFLSGSDDVSISVTALKAGAADFLQKPVSGDVLIKAISEALGKQAVDRRDKQALKVAHKRFEALTEREWEVLTRMLCGPVILSSKEVARELDISHRTVEHHRAHIMNKTRSNSIPELIRLASFIGITNPFLETTEFSELHQP